jgi:hypothetical protein
VRTIQGATGPQGDKGEQCQQGQKGDKGEDGKSAYAYAQDAGYTGTEAEFAEKLAAPETNLNILSVAEEGQTIVVKAVDENGKPTQWEAVDFPSGEKQWVDIVPKTETGEVLILTIEEDSNGNPFSCNELFVLGENFGHCTDNTGKNMVINIKYNGSWIKLGQIKPSDYSRATQSNILIYNRGGFYTYEYLNSGSNSNPDPVTMYGLAWQRTYLSADLPITGIQFAWSGSEQFHSTSKICLRGR